MTDPVFTTVVRATAVLALLVTTMASAQEPYLVGVAAVDITPEYPIRLNGFGNRRAESEGVSQRIFAKALAISQGDHPPLVLVTLDSLGVRMPMVEQVAKRLAASHQVPAQNLAVTFTHSHCTPKVNGACDNIFSSPIPDDHQAHIDRYTRELTDHITKVARQALDSRQQSELLWAVGKVSFAKNRRTAGGPVDHDLPLLVVRDPDTKKPRAIYVSYACHCVTLSFNLISGDWAGHAAAMIERRFPGTTALVSIGAGSDQNPISGVTGDKVEVAVEQGMQIADEVGRLLDGPLRLVTGVPQSSLTKIALPLNEPPSREELVAQTGQGRPTDQYNATTQLAKLDRGETLLRQIDYPIQTWTFGDSLCMNFLAGEVCVDYSLRLKSTFDRERYWLNAYSNDFCSYIPSERLVREGGYGGGSEVPYFALPSTLKSGLEQLIVDEVLRQVPESFLAAEGTQGVPPKSPESSLECISALGDLQVELVAAEPQVMDPVAIDFGPDGRLWVAEMNEYGRGVYEQFSQNSRVRWLRDRDGDGRFETAVTFMDGLRFPTDVKVWRDGILICDAPEIKFARDTDGDGRADEIKTLFSGFEVRNAQARVNSLRWGLDGWLYGSGGLFGGVITSHVTQESVDCRNRDFRIDPDQGIIQAVSGRTQQGRCRNDWGDWFGCSNGTLLRAIPWEHDDTSQPRLIQPSSPNRLDLSPDALRLYPPENLVRFELTGTRGQATAACGLGIYRDTLLGTDFIDDAFTCEPVHQSVHRIDLFKAGHGYSGRRGAGHETAEFVSSTDQWFRPVQARTGPDGALWIVDMYRYVIEHSRWIPQSTLAELDVFAGQRRGRIYRVVPVGKTSGRDRQELIPELHRLSDQELAERLRSNNGTVRDLVHQMLRWRDAKGVTDMVRRVAADESHSAAQIQALATLVSLGSLSASDLAGALSSQNSETVRFAVGLAKPVLHESATIQSLIAGLATHPDPRIRRQVALLLASAEFSAVAPTLTRLMSADETDADVRSAALSSVNAANVDEVVTDYLSDTANRTADVYHPLNLLALRLGNADTLQTALAAILPDKRAALTRQRATTFAAAMDALDRRDAAAQESADAAISDWLVSMHQSAFEVINRDDATDDQLKGSLVVLGRKPGSYTDRLLRASSQTGSFGSRPRAAAIASLISPSRSAAIQQQAVQVLSQISSQHTAALLLDVYPQASPAVRSTIIDALVSRDDGAAALLTALREGRVRGDGLDATRRQKLLKHPQDRIRLEAERVLSTSKPSSRTEVLQTFQQALSLPGDATQGQAAFGKHCSNCHKLFDEGHVVGPNLLALTNRDPAWLLTAILDPNRNVDGRYMSWTALTIDGRVVSGLIVEETSTAIRLREAGGKEHLMNRSDLESFRSSELSVMPEGLEKDISPAEMRNIIAYLIHIRPSAKVLAGNQPARVTPDDHGAVSLTAATAEIRGREITFETQYSNIGYWCHEDDSATWTFKIPSDASYDVYVHAACDRSVAGNRFLIEGLDHPIGGTVASTGGWERYRSEQVATVALAAGDHELVVRPDGAVKGALFDLKEVRLVPAGTAPMFPVVKMSDGSLPRYPAEIAPFLLDDAQPEQRRQQAIHDRPGMGPAILSLLVQDRKPAETAEQDRRRQWIRRVALAVGQRNDGGEIRDVLELSVPRTGQPLLDWQAVVIGGGLIHGVSELGLSPKSRFDEVFAGLPSIKANWPAVLALAVSLANDDKVTASTRRDALRMVALQAPEAAVADLKTYLGVTSDPQLRMAAVRGLVDVDSPQADALLADELPRLTGRTRLFALEGMLRTDARSDQLAKLLETHRLKLHREEVHQLIHHPVDAIQARALAQGLNKLTFGPASR